MKAQSLFRGAHSALTVPSVSVWLGHHTEIDTYLGTPGRMWQVSANCSPSHPYPPWPSVSLSSLLEILL